MFGAEPRTHSAQAQRWIAAQIPAAGVEVFETEQGGSHAMFCENAERFNAHLIASLTT